MQKLDLYRYFSSFLFALVILPADASTISIGEACLQSEQGWRRIVKVALNRLRDPLAARVKEVKWPAYCDCYSQKMAARPKTKGSLTPDEIKLLQDQDGREVLACVKLAGFDSPVRPQSVPLVKNPYFETKIQMCSKNSIGGVLIIESTLKAIQDPRVDRIRSLNLDRYCQCYIDTIRTSVGDEDAKIVANHETYKVQPPEKMLKLSALQDESIEKCVAEQISFSGEMIRTPNAPATMEPSKLEGFEKVIQSEFVIGKGLGDLKVGLSVQKMQSLLGPTNVVTRLRNYDEYRYGPSLTELKIRTAPSGSDGKIIYIAVNYRFRGPISNGIKLGEKFESVKEKMKPLVPVSEDRNVGLLLFREGAHFVFADYNRGTLEGLIAFDPSTHPLLKKRVPK